MISARPNNKSYGNGFYSPAVDEHLIAKDNWTKQPGKWRSNRPQPVSAAPRRRQLIAIELTRARRTWVESERDSRISEILISTCWLGGVQQEMAKPYSQDLRDRVIDAVKRGK
jgi:hypothetical protein